MEDEILSVTSNLGEVVLDSFFKDGFIRDLPIIGTCFNIVKIGLNISDRIFVEKLKSFIENIEKNSKWREKFSDKEECMKISKQLLYVIDSCDDDDKLKLIGMAFNYLVNGDICSDEFFYIVNIISKSFYPFLKLLLEIDKNDERFKNDGTKYDYTGITHLLNIGALDFDGQTVACPNPEKGILVPPSVIVVLNGYGAFIMELLKNLEESK